MNPFPCEKSMKRDRRFFLLLSILFMSALACQAIGAPGDKDNRDSPRQNQILFRDDFSDPESGWDRIQDADGINDYHEGGYRIRINKLNTYFWSNPGLNFTDVIIEVDATKYGGPDMNDMGVICRYVNSQNFYFFTVSSDGYYGISKLVNGEESLIGMQELQFNEMVIKTGNATNHLQVACIGDNLTLSVNGQTLADVKDSSFQSGDVGLIAGTYDQTGVDILFDNFVVMKP